MSHNRESQRKWAERKKAIALGEPVEAYTGLFKCPTCKAENGHWQAMERQQGGVEMPMWKGFPVRGCITSYCKKHKNCTQ